MMIILRQCAQSRQSLSQIFAAMIVSINNKLVMIIYE